MPKKSKVKNPPVLPQPETVIIYTSEDVFKEEMIFPEEFKKSLVNQWRKNGQYKSGHIGLIILKSGRCLYFLSGTAVKIYHSYQEMPEIYQKEAEILISYYQIKFESYKQNNRKYVDLYSVHMSKGRILKRDWTEKRMKDFNLQVSKIIDGSGYSNLPLYLKGKVIKCEKDNPDIFIPSVSRKELQDGISIF